MYAALIDEARRAATAVYLAAEKGPAENISNLITRLANALAAKDGLQELHHIEQTGELRLDPPTMRWRKKPTVVEAVQFREGLEHSGVCHWDCALKDGRNAPHLHTIHANQVVFLVDGDWIIPEPDGEHFYPCKPDIFEATYEPA